MDPNNNFINVRVITPKETLFQGTALSVSSVNTEGRFDILAQHANFITLIEKHPIDIRLTDQREIHFNFSQAIIYTYKNDVSIFAEPLTS